MGSVIRFLLVACAAAPLAWPQTHALLVDRSGSMTPYFANGNVQRITGRIYQLLEATSKPRVLAFSGDVKPVASLEAIEAITPGSNTYLDRAVGYAQQNGFSTAWIVTDNLQHAATDLEAGNTEAFYAVLRSAAVKRVVIFPFPQAPGLPGIVVYALAFDSGAEAAFRGATEMFGTGGTRPLTLKPLDHDTVEFRPMAAGRSAPPIFREGQAITHYVDARLGSKFKYLALSDSPIRASAQTDFEKGSLIVPEKSEIRVKPDRVTDLPPGGETVEVYRVSVDLGKVRLKKDPRSLWKAAFGQTHEEIELRIPVEVEVPQANFRWQDTVVDGFNAKTVEEAKATGKVYGVESLPQLLAEPSTRIGVVIPMTFRVQYPAYMAVLAIGGIAVLLLAAGLGIWALVRALSGRERTGAWAVTAEIEGGGVLSAGYLPDGIVEVDLTAVGQVKGTQFRVNGYAAFDDGAASQAVYDGARARLRMNERVVIVTFRTPAGQEPASPGEEVTDR